MLDWCSFWNNSSKVLFHKAAWWSIHFSFNQWGLILFGQGRMNGFTPLFGFGSLAHFTFKSGPWHDTWTDYHWPGRKKIRKKKSNSLIGLDWKHMPVRWLNKQKYKQWTMVLDHHVMTPHLFLVPCTVLLCSHCKLSAPGVNSNRSKIHISRFRSRFACSFLPKWKRLSEVGVKILVFKVGQTTVVRKLPEYVTHIGFQQNNTWNPYGKRKKTVTKETKGWLHSFGVSPSCSSQTEAIWEPNNRNCTFRGGGGGSPKCPRYTIPFFSFCLDTALTTAGAIWKRLNKRWSDSENCILFLFSCPQAPTTCCIHCSLLAFVIYRSFTPWR